MGLFVADGALNINLQGVVTREGYSCLYVAIDAEITYVITNDGKLARDIVVQEVALLTTDFASNEQILFDVSPAPNAISIEPGHSKSSELVRGKCRHSHLHPLLKAFAKGKAHGVLDAESSGAVLHVRQVAIVEIGVVVLGCGVAVIGVLQIVEPHGVDDACYRNELLVDGQFRKPLLLQAVEYKGSSQRVGRNHLTQAIGESTEQFPFAWHLRLKAVGNLYLLLESHVVAMGEEEVLVLVSVPRLAKQCGNVLRPQVLVFFGASDVEVVLDASVFRHLQVIEVDVGVHVVAIAQIVAKDVASKLAVGLVIVISTSVEVVELHAYACLLVDVRGEVGVHSLLSVSAIAHFVVGKIGHGREGVGEAEVAKSANQEIEGLEEELRIAGVAMEEDAAQAWRTQITEDVVFTIISAGLIVPLEIVNHRVVVLGRDNASQALVHRPLRHTYGNYESIVFIRRVPAP